MYLCLFTADGDVSFTHLCVCVLHTHKKVQCGYTLVTTTAEA